MSVLFSVCVCICVCSCVPLLLLLLFLLFLLLSPGLFSLWYLQIVGGVPKTKRSPSRFPPWKHLSSQSAWFQMDQWGHTQRLLLGRLCPVFTNLASCVDKTLIHDFVCRFYIEIEINQIKLKSIFHKNTVGVFQQKIWQNFCKNWKSKGIHGVSIRDGCQSESGCCALAGSLPCQTSESWLLIGWFVGFLCPLLWNWAQVSLYSAAHREHCSVSQQTWLQSMHYGIELIGSLRELFCTSHLPIGF